MNFEILPHGFPSELAAAAFIAGQDVAWPTSFATAAVQWLGAHGYAVLGAELWLLQGAAIQSLPVGLSGKREVHYNAVKSEQGESWDSFVARSANETCAYLESFNPADIVEQGRLHFNITWVDEHGFRTLVAR
jgi:hypothetical protein